MSAHPRALPPERCNPTVPRLSCLQPRVSIRESDPGLSSTWFPGSISSCRATELTYEHDEFFLRRSEFRRTKRPADHPCSSRPPCLQCRHPPRTGIGLVTLDRRP